MRFSKTTLLEMGLIILGGISEVILLAIEEKKNASFEENFEKCYQAKLECKENEK